MLPGPILIKRCKSCRGLLKEKTIVSGNTIGAKYWTDGEMQARMLPWTPELIKCSHCSGIQFADKLKKVDEVTTYFGLGALLDKSPEIEARVKEQKRKENHYEALPYYEEPNADELFAFANLEMAAHRQLQVRLSAWRKGNNVRRYSDKSNPLMEVEKINLQRLVYLMDSQKHTSNLIYAEALRELGRFEESRRIIDVTNYEENENVTAQFILELIDQEDSQVCLIKLDCSLEWRLRRRLRRRERGESPIFDPYGPNLFEVMSRDWWFKVVSMLCHNWALIEENSNGTATVFFFYDQGIAEANDSNFKYSELKGRSAVIDSLNFENVNDAKYDLHKNGFNRLDEKPGPWDGQEPVGIFYDARSIEKGVYSKSGLWRLPNQGSI